MRSSGSGVARAGFLESHPSRSRSSFSPDPVSALVRLPQRVLDLLVEFVYLVDFCEVFLPLFVHVVVVEERVVLDLVEDGALVDRLALRKLVLRFPFAPGLGPRDSLAIDGRLD